MRRTAVVLAAFAVLSTACRRDPSPDPPPMVASSEPARPVLRPGDGIGPIRLGMTLADLAALGLAPKPTAWSKAVYDAGPYRVVVRDGIVDSVEVELATLPDGVVVGGAIVPPTERSIEAIAAHLDGCGPLEIREGGNVIRCDGGTTYVKAAGPPGIVGLQVVARPEGQS